MFYLKLAISNLKSSIGHYAPFLLASLLLYSLNCSTLLIMMNPMAKGMGTGATTLGLALVVLSLFALIMERYSYKILLKQRSREFGLYNILGMNKKQVGLIATFELALIFLCLLIFGTIFSAIFAKFIYVIFVNITNYDQLNLQLMVSPFILNALIFAGIFFLLWLTALAHIRLSSPLNLFRQQEQGEKEPRGSLILAALSLLAIGIAYYMALTSGKMAALAVIYRFFIAVLLVILGTYLFYISFMTWYLKTRRKQKNYYYKPEHFVSTSQMIFRMKQNAAGLASISLLAVMALVTIGTTVSLYSNTQNVANGQFLKNTKLVGSTNQEVNAPELFKKNVLTKLDKSSDDAISYSWGLAPLIYSKDTKHITLGDDYLKSLSPANTHFAFIVSQDDFKKLGNRIPTLKANQAVFYDQGGSNNLKTIAIDNQKLTIIKQLNSVKLPETLVTVSSSVLVVSDSNKAQTLYNYLQGTSKAVGVSIGSGFGFTAHIDLTKSEIDKLKASGIIGENSNQFDLSTRSTLLNDLYGLFGGLLFTGFLLGVSFLLGIALIIYYKQYSEGHEDKKSYKILQEVGMDERQIKKTINSQIILFFFMPLGIATLHYLIALPMLKQMLLTFGVTDAKLVYTVSAITIAVIALIYLVIYRLTSRAYYKIIER